MNSAANKTTDHNSDLDTTTEFVSCFDFDGRYCEIEHTNFPAAMTFRSSSKLSVRTWAVERNDFID